MTTTDILNALQSAGEPVKKLHINKQIDLAEGATWLDCTLTLTDDSILDVCIIIHSDGAWFTPADWQGPMPASPDEIAEFDWRAGCSGKPAIVLNGLPRVL